MSERRQPEEKAPEAPPTVTHVEQVATPEEEENAYPVQMLIDSSERLFGQPNYVVIGALAAAKLDKRVKLTKEKVQVAVNEFMATTDKAHARAIEAQEGR